MFATRTVARASRSDARKQTSLTGCGRASASLHRVLAMRFAGEPIGTVRQIYDGVLTPEIAVNTFRNIDRLFPTRTVRHSSTPMPLPPASTPLSVVSFSNGGKRYDLDDYLELNRAAGLLVLK